MIPVPSGVRVRPATGHTDMRCGFPGFALKVRASLCKSSSEQGFAAWCPLLTYLRDVLYCEATYLTSVRIVAATNPEDHHGYTTDSF
jgi:hypothetical protein